MCLKCQKSYPHLSFHVEGSLLVTTLLLSAIVHVSGSYANLRRPRLELLQTNKYERVFLHFYNLDTLSIRRMEDAVNCTVKGGHMELTEDGWKPVTWVTLNLLPNMEVWNVPKVTGGHESQKLQTRTTYNVTYDVEGNLTCSDTLGLGLVSNTILIQQKNSASVLVNLTRDLPLPEMQQIFDDYDIFSYLDQKARLISMVNGTNSEVLLRIIYSNSLTVADDDKVVTDVKEVTEIIAKKWNFTLRYVWSTRSCLSVEEGNYTWPMTTAGQIVVPINFCLDNDGNPIPYRKCVGNYFEGVRWDTAPPKPHICLDPHGRSTRLKNITSLYSRKNVLEMLANEISDETKLSPTEIYFVSEALKKTAEEINSPTSEISSIKTSTVVKVINSILQSGKEVMKLADESYGSSTLILESIEQLLQAAASPMPTPVSMFHFSAFASVAGTGIRGFGYSIVNGTGRMDSIVNLDSILRLNPIVVAYLSNKKLKLNIISTFYKDGSLFSAANTIGQILEGPVFGMKMFHKYEETQEPITVTIKVALGKNMPFPLQCVTWEPSREGGWSPAGCDVLRSYSAYTLCSCTLLTSLDTFFTVIKAKNGTNRKTARLTLLPMKNNVGALLHVYEAKRIITKESLDKVIVCSVNRDGETNIIPLRKVLEGRYTYTDTVVIYSLSYRGDGYAECSIGKSLISNKCLLLVQNRAFLRFKAEQSVNTVEIIQNYVEKHYLEFNFTKISKEDPGIEVFLVSQYSRNNHLHFIEELKNIFKDLSAAYNFTLIEITSNRLCLKHEEGGFLWPNAQLQHRATPINPCIDTNGAPTPSRLCMGDHLNGMYWEEVPQRPHPCIMPSKKSQKLQDLVTNAEKKDAFEEILKSIEGEATISIVELKLLAETLKSTAEEVSKPNSKVSKPNITSIVKMVDTIITAEFEDPKEEKMTVSSEEILDAIDTLLEKASTDVPEAVSTPRFSAIAAAPGSRYRGFVAVTNNSVTESNIEGISWNDSVIETFHKPIDTGAILVEAPNHAGVAFSVFNNQSLFYSDKEDTNLFLDTPVVGFNIFGVDKEELSDVQNLTVIILFNRGKSGSSKNRECYYWDKNIRKWSNEGVIKIPSCNLPGEIPDDMDACMSTHLTHFAMLVSTVQHHEEEMLYLLTLVGCSVSFFCLLGIFAMAVFSRKWRHGANKKVQLNLSASLAMLMVSYLAVETLGECPKSMAWCVALGAMIHYSVLAAFSWMLVVAVLQLLRLTPGVSMDARRRAGTHLVLKSSIFGWGFPVILVGATLAMGTDIYVRRENTAFCYPSGRAFYIAVLFPVLLAISMNTVVFIWLVHILFCNKMQVMRVHQKSQAMRRFFSALFLFCLLGITWITGIFVEITVSSEMVSKVLSYAFCVTATLQGTSLFIFFVVCDRGVGKKMMGAISSLSARSGGSSSRNGYTNKFESSSSEKTTNNMELSNNSIQKKKKTDRMPL